MYLGYALRRKLTSAINILINLNSPYFQLCGHWQNKCERNSLCLCVPIAQRYQMKIFLILTCQQDCWCGSTSILFTKDGRLKTLIHQNWLFSESLQALYFVIDYPRTRTKRRGFFYIMRPTKDWTSCWHVYFVPIIIWVYWGQSKKAVSKVVHWPRTLFSTNRWNDSQALFAWYKN